jgi:D-lactate dehydrogenase (cytochrome)
MSWVLKSRPPAGRVGHVEPIRDPDLLHGRLEDAAHYPGGHLAELFAPSSEAELAEILRAARTVLAVGAQSSLTGGATPMGDTLVTTDRFNRIAHVGPDRVRVGAGVALTALDRALETRGRAYPPAPTFTGATVGGIVSTNAAGAATFKHGTTRPWVEAVTVVLASGDVLDIERGETHAHPDGYFEVERPRGAVRVPVPRYRMPAVPKLSAGYFAGPGMDLIDLFIGSEGTLGVITEVTLRVLPTRAPLCHLFVTFNVDAHALDFARRLRDRARHTWQTLDPHGVDVAAIESVDARCLALLREDGIDRRHHVDLPADAVVALLVTLELRPGTTAETLFDQIGSAQPASVADGPLASVCGMLAELDALDRAVVALPGDSRRAADLLAVREAVPAGVNQRVGLAQRTIDPRIAKIAADTIVPFDRLAEYLTFARTELSGRGLDAAIWGHLSDGNLHPNIIPRSVAEIDAGLAAVLALGREAIRLGGAPLAEHGVGRNPVKQQLLEDLYRTDGVGEMRRVKAALDPEWKLAPGVIFSR